MADILTVAKAQIGQGPATYRGWYERLFEPSWAGQSWAWCAGFASWCVAHSDTPNAIRLRAYVPYLVTDAKAAGTWTQTPKSGDLVIFDWERDGLTDHVGIVEQVYADGSIVAVEGNAAPTVGRFWRPRNLIAGFVRTPIPTSPQEDDMPLTEDDLNRIASRVLDTVKIGPTGQQSTLASFVHAAARDSKAALDAVAGLRADLAKASTSTGGVSADALAEAVAANLAKRMQS